MTIEPRPDDSLDTTATRDVIRALAATGDYSKLDDAQRGDVIRALCSALRLNPFAKPFEFIRLNGKLVLYATRGATDQLAAVHRLNRRIVRGPEIVDLLGKKTVLAVCEATLPNGRVEQSTATCDVADACGIHNVLMKTETKAKRRATLAILGLAVLDESEVVSVENVEPRRPPVVREEPEGSRAFAAFVAAVGVCERVIEVNICYRDLLAGLHEEGADAQKYLEGNGGAYSIAAAAIRRRVSVNEAELRAVLASETGELARSLDAVAEHATDLDTAARWWVRCGAIFAPDHKPIAWKALARGVARIDATDAVATGRAVSALRDACKALTPPEPPTGTDAPSAATQTASVGDSAQSTTADAPSAWSPVTTSDGVVIDDEASARRHISALNVWALRASYARHTEPGWRALVVEAYASRAEVTRSAAALTLAADAARRATAARDERLASKVRRAA
jgi:hypothetical protein